MHVMNQISPTLRICVCSICRLFTRSFVRSFALFTTLTTQSLVDVVVVVMYGSLLYIWVFFFFVYYCISLLRLIIFIFTPCLLTLRSMPLDYNWLNVCPKLLSYRCCLSLWFKHPTTTSVSAATPVIIHTLVHTIPIHSLRSRKYFKLKKLCQVSNNTFSTPWTWTSQYDHKRNRSIDRDMIVRVIM